MGEFSVGDWLFQKPIGELSKTIQLEVSTPISRLEKQRGKALLLREIGAMDIM